MALDASEERVTLLTGTEGSEGSQSRLVVRRFRVKECVIWLTEPEEDVESLSRLLAQNAQGTSTKGGEDGPGS